MDFTESGADLPGEAIASISKATDKQLCYSRGGPYPLLPPSGSAHVSNSGYQHILIFNKNIVF